MHNVCLQADHTKFAGRPEHVIIRQVCAKLARYCRHVTEFLQSAASSTPAHFFVLLN